MAVYDLGDQVELTIYVTTDAGVPSNADAVTCTITLPDGTTVTATDTNPATGTYAVSYIPATAGRYFVRWLVESIGSVADEDDVYEDTFHVRSSVGALVGMDEVKAQLNIPAADTNYDDELQSFITVVSEAAEAITGQVFRRQTVVATFDGGEEAVLLTKFPALSITSVTESGATVAAAGYSLDAAAGILYRRAGTYSRGCWAEGHRNVVVTYAAGYTDVPAPVRHGALLMLDHLWTTQRGTFGPARAGADDTYLPGSTYSVPNRVLEMWAPYMPVSTP